METVPYSRLPESHGRHVTKGRISEAIGKAKAALEVIVFILARLLVELLFALIWVLDKTLVPLIGHERCLRELILLTDFSKTGTFMFPETLKEAMEVKQRWEREVKKLREFVEAKKNTALPCYAVAIQTHTAPAPGAPCDDGNCVPPSTQMPVALPSNDPARVGGSSDDHPNGIENQNDESSRSTEASPAHPPAITPSNGASPPIREDDSERREPPVPRDIESQRDGNGDSEAIPKEVLLMFALQAFQILSNVKSNGISLLSRRAEIVQYCAEALTVIGFFCGLGVILLRNDRNLRAATNIMSRIGFYFTGLGLIATLCVSLGKFMFWILGFFCFLFSAIYAYALWKGWIV